MRTSATMHVGTRTGSSIAWLGKLCLRPRPSRSFLCKWGHDAAPVGVNFPKGVDTANRLTPILIGTRERGATAYRRCPLFLAAQFFLKSRPATWRRGQSLAASPCSGERPAFVDFGSALGVSRRSGVPVPGSTRVTRGERPGRRQTFTNPAASRRRRASVTA